MDTNQSIAIVNANHLNQYILELEFNDHSKQQVDFYPFLSSSLNPLIRKYLKEEEFKNFNIDHGDLEWNNYDLCFPIADLYENSLLHRPIL